MHVASFTFVFLQYPFSWGTIDLGILYKKGHNKLVFEQDN